MSVTLVTPDTLHEIPDSVEVIGIDINAIYIRMGNNGWEYDRKFKWNGLMYISGLLYLTTGGVVNMLGIKNTITFRNGMYVKDE